MRASILLASGLLTALLAPAALAQQAEPGSAELRERLEAQEERLRELENRQDEEQALEQRLEEQQERIDELESSRFDSSGSGGRGPKVDVSGFINTGFQQTNLGPNDPVYRENSGATDSEVRATNFTSAGLQVDGTITNDLSGTVQFLAEGQEGLDARMEWAYLTYDLASSVEVRAGRIVAPLYMNSQSFYVGYSHPWVEPPAEVYDTAAVRTFDGADISWQFNTGEIAHTLNYYAGSAPVDTLIQGNNVIFDVHNLHGLNLSSTYGNLNTWLSYNNGDVGLDLPSACISNPGPRPPNPPPAGTGCTTVGNFNQYSLDNDDAYFGSVGFEYDNGNVLFTAEHIELDIKGWFPKSRAHYATLGYRFGAWMPHLTWANTESDSFDEVEGDLGAETLYNNLKSNQSSWTLGLRGDVAPGLALKAEVSTYYDIGERNAGLAPNPKDSGLFSGAIPDDEEDPMVFRLAANLVF